jgi:hypothetical protein
MANATDRRLPAEAGAGHAGWHRRGQDVARLPLRSLLSLAVVVAGGWVLVA